MSLLVVFVRPCPSQVGSKRLSCQIGFLTHTILTFVPLAEGEFRFAHLLGGGILPRIISCIIHRKSITAGIHNHGGVPLSPSYPMQDLIGKFKVLDRKIQVV